jgi:hypothetical protein
VIATAAKQAPFQTTIGVLPPDHSTIRFDLHDQVARLQLLGLRAPEAEGSSITDQPQADGPRNLTQRPAHLVLPDLPFNQSHLSVDRSEVGKIVGNVLTAMRSGEQKTSKI